MTTASRQSLGRGLSALLGEEVDDYKAMDRLRASKSVPVDSLYPSPFQPRRRFSEDEMEALTESIREKGVLQPLLVRRDSKNTARYEIIAGERRWRASLAAGLSEVPVFIKDLSDKDALEVALIENVQRQDLTATEEAEGYQRLIDEFGHTQDALAKAIGKSRSHIANMLRLLKLPQSVRDMLDNQQITMGHARALITMPEPEALARVIVEKHLSVRDIENMGHQQRFDAPLPVKEKSARSHATTRAFRKECQEIENTLSRIVGLKVHVRVKRRGGDVIISYKSTGELQTIVKRLTDLPVLLAD